jgi:hypothetical protein
MHRNIQKNRRPRPQPCLKRRSTRGFARYADREHVSGGRNRTIDRSNLNGLRAGADAQGMDLRAWLRSLGLEQYEATFRENAIDDTVVRSLTVEDLKD